MRNQSMSSEEFYWVESLPGCEGYPSSNRKRDNMMTREPHDRMMVGEKFMAKNHDYLNNTVMYRRGFERRFVNLPADLVRRTSAPERRYKQTLVFTTATAALGGIAMHPDVQNILSDPRVHETVIYLIYAIAAFVGVQLGGYSIGRSFRALAKVGDRHRRLSGERMTLKEKRNEVSEMRDARYREQEHKFELERIKQKQDTALALEEAQSKARKEELASLMQLAMNANQPQAKAATAVPWIPQPGDVVRTLKNENMAKVREKYLSPGDIVVVASTSTSNPGYFSIMNGNSGRFDSFELVHRPTGVIA